MATDFRSSYAERTDAQTIQFRQMDGVGLYPDSKGPRGEKNGSHLTLPVWATVGASGRGGAVNGDVEIRGVVVQHPVLYTSVARS